MAPHVGVPRIFLSTQMAGPRERRLALMVVLVSVAIFAAAAPFARVPLPRIWAFIPIYQSALIINDLITAVLLISQIGILRSRGLLVLAGGYLFSALMAGLHGLSFPGLFAPEGLIGGGFQTTAWLHIFWHAGFPLAVIAYVLLNDGNAGDRSQIVRVGPAIAVAVAAVIGLVAGLTLVATAGHAWLPIVSVSDHHTAATNVAVTVISILCLIALTAVWRRRPHSVLDLWLMVLICAWQFDVALSVMLNAERFDFGFYAGRIYGLSAASFVLIVMLIETGALYARAARSFEIDRLERERELNEVQSELIHLARLNELGQMISALAHEVSQPLAALGNYLRATQRLIEQGDSIKACAAIDVATEQVHRADQIISNLRAFAKRGKTARQAERLAAVIEEVLELALLSPEGRRMAVTIRIDPQATYADIDKIQIQQVLLNMIRNAAEAMATCPRSELLITTSRAEEGLIEISILDTGPGLAGAVLEKLFQPFVTTKADGMGIGLSICQAIIEAHGGRIWTSHKPDGGTAFHFTVPLASAEQRNNLPMGVALGALQS
jgi:signal transduction histidine kinase